MKGKNIIKPVAILLLVSVWLLSGYPKLSKSGNFPPSIEEVQAITTDLVITSCDLDNVSNTNCYNAISSDGSTSFALGKNQHIDAPFQIISLENINSATLYYDSWGSLSGSWGIYLKDARDGTTICSLDPGPEDGSETTNNMGCSITPTQLTNGAWLQINNDDTKGPEIINLDYIRLNIDYNPIVSISITSDGTISYGSVSLDNEQDTTNSGVNDTQTATNNGNLTEDFNIKTSHAVNGAQWSVGTMAGTDIFVHSFSLNDGASWEVLDNYDTYETLTTGISPSSSQNFDLKIHVPTFSSDYQEKTITITVQAVQS